MKHEGKIGRVEQVKVPEYQFPFLELRSYQKTVFDNIVKNNLPLPSQRFGRYPYFDEAVFYKKPKWYQWRLRRKYRRILETK